ncbi:TetR family transcriptional regulator [Reticulibacter mediterranei]|uniref:TetR family transcriptional regulator n=1 Tax=Reticulibacter mediterranei TaxID=2778369 RepID=A0A8J3IGD5_9CHLR|nr:TetR/AcrR family transcriptional regulator [Reticulibacter mediterranei]GHO94979.1 TetR family transcriptional regulator [Reticulibacter mediterranei]
MTEKQALRVQMKRQQMRVAAQRLFLQRGFTATSMDMITAEAGVSKQTLYSYYTNKEDLFADVLQQLTLNNPHNQLLAIDHMPDLKDHDALRAALMTLAQEIATIMMQPEYLALLRVIIAETPRFPQLATRFRTTVPERSLAYIAALLKQAQEEGLITHIDWDAAALMFIGSLLTYALLNGLLSGDEPPQPPTSAQLAPSIDLFMKAISS